MLCRGLRLLVRSGLAIRGFIESRGWDDNRSTVPLARRSGRGGGALTRFRPGSICPALLRRRPGGRVVMQRPAKPRTSVRFRPGPPTRLLVPPPLPTRPSFPPRPVFAIPPDFPSRRRLRNHRLTKARIITPPRGPLSERHKPFCISTRIRGFLRLTQQFLLCFTKC